MQQPNALLACFDPPPKLTVVRERGDSLSRRHPWVFEQALVRPPKNLPLGVTVELVDGKGRFAGRGSYNCESRIAVRMMTYDENELVTETLWAQRIADAVGRRAALADSDTDAYRLVFSENDLLPGLIVDRYGDYVVFQTLSAGASLWRDTIARALVAVCQPRGLFERSDGDDRRQHEGLEPSIGTLYGDEPPEHLLIRQDGLTFGVDIRAGHKTGFYLDQRQNRRALAAYCAGADVLNGFSYTGGFGVYAGAAGAKSVVHLDSSAPALELCRENVERNGVAGEHEYLCENAFGALRAMRDEGRTFDVVVLDPPKFASSKQHLEKAARGYKELNLSAIKLLRPGGVLATFSCSGAMERPLFYRAVAEAAKDAGRDLLLEAELGHPTDHPTLLSFPEGSYLKGLIARVV
ncbi:MAG: class I SAM-dependent rRNA methyltransferase [Armatimonadetes bacterium]|nr:class I SAM-dependent rRNA methyltransferase [Armatimonadota bacterium]